MGTESTTRCLSTCLRVYMCVHTFKGFLPLSPLCPLSFLVLLFLLFAWSQEEHCMYSQRWAKTKEREEKMPANLGEREGEGVPLNKLKREKRECRGVVGYKKRKKRRTCRMEKQRARGKGSKLQREGEKGDEVWESLHALTSTSLRVITRSEGSCVSCVHALLSYHRTRFLVLRRQARVHKRWRNMLTSCTSVLFLCVLRREKP